MDYGAIEDMILEIEAKYNVVVMGVGYDRYNCLSTAQRLEREGLKTVESNNILASCILLQSYFAKKSLTKNFLTRQTIYSKSISKTQK